MNDTPLHDHLHELALTNLQFERDAFALVLRELNAITARLELIEAAIQNRSTTQ